MLKSTAAHLDTRTAQDRFLKLVALRLRIMQTTKSDKRDVADKLDEEPSRRRSNLLGTRPAVTAKQHSAISTPSPDAAAATENVTSRLFIKNLPAALTANKLQSIIAARCAAPSDITDCDVKFTRDGRPRQLAFVGLRNETIAKAVKEYFDATFIWTHRIAVEYAQPKRTMRQAQQHGASYPHIASSGDGAPVVEHKTQRQKKSLLQRIGVTDEKARELESDPHFRDYLSVMAPDKSKQKFWENDDFTEQNDRRSEQKEAKDGAAANGDGSDDEEYYKNRGAVDDSAGDNDAMQPDDHLVTDPAISLQEYLKSRQTANDDDDDDEDHTEHTRATQNITGTQEDDDDDDDDDDDNDTAVERAKRPPVASTISDFDPHRLFVRNLVYSLTATDIRQYFSSFGAISDVTLPVTPTGVNKGYAIVTFDSAESAQQAVDAADGSILSGRIITVVRGKPPPQKAEPKPVVPAKGGYKAQKRQEMKANSQSSLNWNTLFLRSQTVLDSVAAKLGVSKSVLMDPSSSSSLAVRLALAESSLIDETKQFLQSFGVDADLFDVKDGSERTLVRSSSVILVKNIPYDTAINELRSLFDSFGPVGRVVMPPIKTIAIIEFLADADAKRAFTALAYSMFHHTPLYLEWAPINMFNRAATDVKLTAATKAVAVTAAPSAADVFAVSDDIDDGDVNTVYVKNINFATTEAALRNVFGTIGPVRSITIAKRRAKSAAAKAVPLGLWICRIRECTRRTSRSQRTAIGHRRRNTHFTYKYQITRRHRQPMHVRRLLLSPQ